MAIQTLLAIAIVVPCSASWAPIAGYAPGSKVTDHNAIDLDQAALEIVLKKSTIDYSVVKKIYEQGGNSKSYAEFTVPPLASALGKGDAVVGKSSGAKGKVYTKYVAGATTIRVAYSTGYTQATYVKCKEGALAHPPLGTSASATEPYKFTTGCFRHEALVITSSSGDVTVNPSGAPTNKAGRTLQGFSTKAKGTMYTTGPKGGCAGASDRATDGCPYTDFKMYYNYFGDFDYADKFVSAAIDAQPTAFAKSAGNMDFTGTSDSLRKECIKKGTAYMNAHMYAIREFEDAIDDCKAGCANGIVSSGADCNSLSTASVHAWDEGVAFYTGSLEGPSEGGTTKGKLSYRLAEKRCANFKTCGTSAWNHNTLTTGVSLVNIEIFRELAIGQSKLLLGRCDDARPSLRRIVALMAIPLIQGTLRYAYKLHFESGGDKERGEGAVFATAVVPRVASCSSADAQTIMSNMKVGASSTSFASVKAAFENNYACMGITCKEVGGLWSAEGKYYDGAEPCDLKTSSQITKTEDKIPTWAIGIIVAVCVILVLFFLGCCMVVWKEKRSGRPAFARLKEGPKENAKESQMESPDTFGTKAEV